jgi:hypothetical protein
MEDLMLRLLTLAGLAALLAAVIRENARTRLYVPDLQVLPRKTRRVRRGKPARKRRTA